MSTDVEVPPLEVLEGLVDALQAEDLSSVAGARLDAELVGLSRLLGRLEAEVIRRAGAWERSGQWAHDGSRSAAAALARRTGLAPGTAKDRLRLARRLRSAPVTAAALGAGRLSVAKARHQCSLVGEDRTDTLRDAFARAEADLVTAAERVSVRDTAWLARHFFAAADPDGFERDCERDFERNRFDVAQSFQGSGHVGGFVDAESLTIVHGALASMEDRLFRAQQRTTSDEPEAPRMTPAQRRAEAFVAICASVLDDDPDRDHTTTGVARPVIAALLDLTHTHHHPHTIGTDGTDEARAGGCGGGHDHGPEPAVVLAESNQPLPRSSRQRLLCDAVFVHVLTNAGQPLHVGRARRNPTTAIVRALVARDGGCAFPGCETPARFCQAHHIHHWEHGGPTAISNLVLLCRHHHRLLHHSRWTVRLPPDTGLPTFTDPHGTTHPANPPPHHHARTARHLAHHHQPQPA